MMKLYHYQTRKKSVRYSTKLWVPLSLILLSNTIHAQTIAIKENQIIEKKIKYDHVTLHLEAGFIIKNSGSIDIENSIIDVNISPSNPYFAKLTSGTMTLKNNVFNVTTTDITPNPNTQLYQLLQVENGSVTITGNKFTIDNAYTVGVFGTQNQLTNGFNISNNTFNNFHGGLYLVNSNSAEINQNIFNRVSLSNIYYIGNTGNFKKNQFLFPGNLSLGNAVDIVNANGVLLSENIIASGSSYGISITGGQNIVIDNNKITDGLSYGIFIQTPSIIALNKNSYIKQLTPKYKSTNLPNNTITINNNYIEQNRYGLAGGIVNNLIVKNNIFIQKFSDNSTRQFWTNNDILLPSATNVTWQNNRYKEAFTQEVPGDNSLALQFVTFPAHGGVSLT